ncbi:MAG: hypothetical protein Q7J85_05945 [Bacillota bacterium]|nr:hypothetical protein [Bacillota bacterium]MDP2196336.1 hypothetical protein [Rhodocyclaceae bacterium]
MVTIIPPSITVDNLSKDILSKFRPGLLKLAGRAGWQPAELPAVAWLAAHDALQDYDESKGSLLARAWFFVQQQARAAGFLPAGDAADLALATAGGGGDPADEVDAMRLARRIEALGIGAAPERGAARSQRRHVEELRGAAERFAMPQAQAELF